MAQRDHRGMTTVRAPVFRLERLNLTVPYAKLEKLRQTRLLRDVPLTRARLSSAPACPASFVGRRGRVGQGRGIRRSTRP